MSLKTPILFVVFNRPDTTKIVFEEIRKQKPQKLFIAADGPRENNLEDLEKCNKVKEIFKDIDWPCEVNTLYRTNNLGCKIAVSQAINWFFTHVEEGIILEDDVLPSETFFCFCEDMLVKYRESKEIMHVSGFNPLGSWKNDKQSYHFSFFGNIWGWATWRRAWQYYDVDIKKWADLKTQEYVLNNYFEKEKVIERKKLYNDLYDGKIDTWDYQWTFCRLLNNGKSVISAINTIENIGFGHEATHTKSAPEWAKIKKFNISHPLVHPKLNIVDKDYDQLHLNLNNRIYSFQKKSRLNYYTKSIFIIRKLKNLFKK